MRISFVLVPLVMLTACMDSTRSERERCIGNAMRDVNVVNRLIEETRANLSRGYALEERTEVSTQERVCQITQEGGGILNVPCNEIVNNRTYVPVAIDLNAEQAKLDSLLQRQPSMQAQANAAVDQCRLYYPETE